MLKERVIDLFFFHLQSFFKDDQEGQMMHTIIEGTPGSGKTEVAEPATIRNPKMALGCDEHHDRGDELQLL